LKIIYPFTVTDESFISSSLIEEAPAEWDNSVSYSVDDLVLNTSSWVLYKSLQDSNLNNEPSSSPAYWEDLGAAPPIKYSSDSTYNIGDLVTVLSTHKIYESLIDANTGNNPPDFVGGLSPKWLEISATNRWKLFDGKLNSKSESYHKSLQYIITSSSIISGIALLQLEGATVNITITDPIEGEVYNNTVNLISTKEVYDWSSYFFEPILFINDTTFLDLPLYRSATLYITISGEERVSLGELVLGKVIDIGYTQYSPTFSIMDYSRKTVDTFGNYSVVERAYSKRTNFSIIVENSKINSISKLLAEIRAIPIVWAATDNPYYESTLLTYGYYRDFSLVIPHPLYSEMDLTVEGLT